jgi:hypothetical protein
LSPFVAFWSAYQSIFTEGPNKSIEVSEETKLTVRKAIGLDCDNFYNIAVVGAAGTGKVKYNENINILRCRYLLFIRAPWSMVF